jgi:hypothetical protein
MRWQAVDSSCIAAIGYSEEWRLLGIRFRESGEVYLYFDVPFEEYTEFMAAESKGTYLNLVFKPKNHCYIIVNGHNNSLHHISIEYLHSGLDPREWIGSEGVDWIRRCEFGLLSAALSASNAPSSES